MGHGMIDGAKAGGYVDVRLFKTKTSNFMLSGKLPIWATGPAKGVTGEAWAHEWLSARSEAGLMVSDNCPLMPAPQGRDGWSQRKLTSFEACLWLRELLQGAGVSKETAGNVGTHSAKATALSWAAKWGLPNSVRRALGGHVKPKEKSVETYSRDYLAGLFRQGGNIAHDYMGATSRRAVPSDQHFPP